MRRRPPIILLSLACLPAALALADGVLLPAPTRAIAPEINAGEVGRLVVAAAPGSTVVAPPGVHVERIRIDKPLTLLGGGRATLSGGGTGDIVEIAAEGVTLNGFTIRDTGDDLEKENAAVRVLAPRATIEDNALENILFGIDVRDGPGCVIRGNRIGGKRLGIARRGDGLRLWRADGAVIENNVIHDGRDAVLWYSTGVVVRGNRSIDCRYGLHLMYSDSVLIEDNTLTGNSVGVYIMYSKGIDVRRNRLIRNRGPSGYGLGLKEADQFTVERNLFAGNRAGVYLDGSPFTTARPGLFRLNTFASNDVGVEFLPAVRGALFTTNNFIDNIEQVSVAGRGALQGNAFFEGETGNYWSDYTGFDADHDGVGDFVHESRTLFESLIDREPSLRLFLFSPVHRAVELVGRALPAVRPEPKFTDEVPLMRPADIGLDAAPAGARRQALGGVALALLTLGAGVCRAALAPRSGAARPASRAAAARLSGAAS